MTPFFGDDDETQVAGTGYIRAAFYYPWFPETWYPTDRQTPVMGKYRSDDPAVLKTHVAQAKYAGLHAFISSWWGIGHYSDKRLVQLLDAAKVGGLRVAPYHELEGSTNPSEASVKRDLDHLKAVADRYGETWLRVDGKPVIHVYNANDTSCSIATKWKRAAGVDWHVVLKVFSGYAACPDQPGSWHQYGPSSGYHAHLPHSATVSPGYWQYNESQPRLARDPARFRADLQRQATSGARWQLVTSWNEHGEGHPVEPANEWKSPSGMGVYLDIMREVYGASGSTPAGTTPPQPVPMTTWTTTTTVTATTTAAAKAPEPVAPPSPAPTPEPSGERVGDPVVAVAGDIACKAGSSVSSGGCHQKATSDLLLKKNYAAVLIPGDLQYDSGSLSDYQRSYHPTWGRVKAKTRPAPGNHEYGTSGAAGYFDYWGAQAGPRGKGWYSFNLGAWHVIALNSNCSKVGCGPDSEQVKWLKADLAANAKRCTAAFWHHPRFSSGRHGDQPSVDTLWDTAVAANVDVIFTGHDHSYERFAPVSGTRHFVVGTGGKNLYTPGSVKPGQEAFNNKTFGVLEVGLHASAFSWRFIPEAGKTYTDAGTQPCH